MISGQSCNKRPRAEPQLPTSRFAGDRATTPPTRGAQCTWEYGTFPGMSSQVIGWRREGLCNSAPTGRRRGDFRDTNQTVCRALPGLDVFRRIPWQLPGAVFRPGRQLEPVAWRFLGATTSHGLIDSLWTSSLSSRHWTCGYLGLNCTSKRLWISCVETCSISCPNSHSWPKGSRMRH